jgi:hypothetical protein
MLISTKNKKKITQETLKHQQARENIFKNVKLHQDKQNKHVPGKHNYTQITSRIGFWQRESSRD